eukprot:411213-Prymnesium_polylepis.1
MKKKKNTVHVYRRGTHGRFDTRAPWHCFSVVVPPSPASSDGSTILEGGSARSAPPALSSRCKTRHLPRAGGGMHCGWLSRLRLPSHHRAQQPCCSCSCSSCLHSSDKRHDGPRGREPTSC